MTVQRQVPVLSVSKYCVEIAVITKNTFISITFYLSKAPSKLINGVRDLERTCFVTSFLVVKSAHEPCMPSLFSRIIWTG